jgi:hypothetical protein
MSSSGSNKTSYLVMCAGMEKPHSTTMEHRMHTAGSEVRTEPAGASERGEAMSNQVIRIENWEVITNPFKMKQYLHGEVYGHPEFQDGRAVTTSSLMDLRDDVAVTKSGTVYRLGKRKNQAFNKAIPCLSV